MADMETRVSRHILKIQLVLGMLTYVFLNESVKNNNNNKNNVSIAASFINRKSCSSYFLCLWLSFGISDGQEVM